MDASIEERVEALRREITKIQTLNLEYLQNPGHGALALSDHERREQRLKEIMDELKGMTD
jgi:hypothetical protein